MSQVPLTSLLVVLCAACCAAAAAAPARGADDPFARARWIWCEGDPAPRNFYLLCRRSVLVDEKPVSAVVHVTADSRYQLFVNGRLLGRGPARADQRWYYYDTYDLAPHLRVGNNVLGIVVHHYGVPTHSHNQGRGGLLLAGEVVLAHGRRLPLDTGEDWRVLPAPQWERDVPRVSPAIMWMEVYDARKEVRGWQAPGFDASAWPKPVLLGHPPVAPWEHLLPRDIPMLREEEVLPVAVLEEGTVGPPVRSARLDLGRQFGQVPGMVAILFACVHSPVDQRAGLLLSGGTPMGGQVWVNGQMYGHGPEEAATAVFDLRKGWNELLILVPRTTPEWTCDLALGPPCPGDPWQPVRWCAAPSESAPGDRAMLAGPFGAPGMPPGMPGPGGPDPAAVVQQVLQRQPGSPFQFPGRVLPLKFGSPANVAARMATEPLHPGPTPGLRGASLLLKPGAGPAVVATAGGDVYAVLDFGKELSGTVRLKLDGAAGGIVDIGYSEVVRDGRIDVLREGPYSFADRYVMRDGPQSWEGFFWKGFRYLQVTFRNCPRPVKVEAVRVLETTYPVRHRGAFECSDPLLNRIWDTSRWTLQHCMHDGYEDTPWREQGQWLGDAQVELMADYYAFGDMALGAKALRQFATGQTDKGEIPAMWPGGATVWPSRQNPPMQLPTFMCQWVSMVLDHDLYSGDRRLTRELYPHVVRLLRYFDGYLGPDGLLVDVPGFIFLDWMADPSVMGMPPGMMGTPSGGSGTLTGMNCHYYRALLDAAELARIAGDDAHRAEWLAKAERVKAAVNSLLWSATQNVYYHGIVNGRAVERLTVQDSVLAAWAGIAPPDRAARSFAVLFGQTPLDAVQIGTPYFYFFYLEAMRRGGHDEQVLAETRQAYGRMLDAGATTWWEHFSGGASRSHAWSCAPGIDLPLHVLGVRPTAPGWEALSVAPEPSGLQWARGTVPTVRGDVKTEWKLDGRTFTLVADVPLAARVELSVPSDGAQPARLDGATATPVVRRGRAVFNVAGPGKFTVSSTVP